MRRILSLWKSNDLRARHRPDNALRQDLRHSRERRLSEIRHPGRVGRHARQQARQADSPRAQICSTACLSPFPRAQSGRPGRGTRRRNAIPARAGGIRWAALRHSRARNRRDRLHTVCSPAPFPRARAIGLSELGVTVSQSPFPRARAIGRQDAIRIRRRMAIPTRARNRAYGTPDAGRTARHSHARAQSGTLCERCVPDGAIPTRAPQ